MARRVKYLNNRDLLKQIHLSKTTYCSYVDPAYANYDIIVNSLSKINRNTIAQARRNRAKKITDAERDAGNKGFKLNEKTIDKEDLIFRVMTYDHVPLEPGRRKTPKSTADHHEKVNFPPFQHYKLDSKGVPQCVGKSHWVGGMKNGHFSKDHGRVTNELAKMYMKLCERYGTRGNWRGYTYNDEMQSQALLQLTQIGLQFDESKSENPFAYYTAAITNSFTRILNVEKKNQVIRDDILELNEMMPSYTRQAQNEQRIKDRQTKPETPKVYKPTQKALKLYNQGKITMQEMMASARPETAKEIKEREKAKKKAEEQRRKMYGR